MEHRHCQRLAITFLCLFIRYALKHFRKFLNINMCSDWLNYICTRAIQLLYAGTHDGESVFDFESLRKIHRYENFILLSRGLHPQDINGTPTGAFADNHFQSTMRKSTSFAFFRPSPPAKIRPFWDLKWLKIKNKKAPGMLIGDSYYHLVSCIDRSPYQVSDWKKKCTSHLQ